MARYDYQKTRLLVEARGKVSLSQAEAGDYFGLHYPKGRDAVAAWELGNSAPKAKRRATFISYLWQKLRLKDEPEQMQLIWREVMVGQWKWAKLQDHELPKEPQHQIPEPTSGFRGRADDVDHAVSHLKNAALAGKVGLCAICGMGGIGKTEVAYEITRQVRDRFPDGQLLLELRGEDGSQMPHEQAVAPLEALKSIIRALTHDHELPDTERELVARYRSALAHRRVLILADNARDTAQVRPFIPPAGSALLVTSRMVINLEGIKTVLLSPLSAEDSEALLVEICPRIGTHAAELARLCGLLPLALRISASTLQQTPMRRPSTYVEHLRAERLLLLVDPEGNPDDPRASVEASLRLSFNALDDDMQQAILQLSVFPASFDVDAANAVLLGMGAVDDLLEKLYRRSMVEWNPETERYALHDLVREFCTERLTDILAVQLRYAQHYAQVAMQVKALYNHDIPGALALFDRERTHIDTGWTWARAHAGNPTVDTVLIAYGQGTFHAGALRYDKRSERLPQMQAMQEAAQRLGERGAEGRALHYIGITYYLLGDWPAAATPSPSKNNVPISQWEPRSIRKDSWIGYFMTNPKTCRNLKDVLDQRAVCCEKSALSVSSHPRAVRTS